MLRAIPGKRLEGDFYAALHRETDNPTLDSLLLGEERV